MRSTVDSDLTISLTSIAGLVDHANELAKRSVRAAQAGSPESAMNLALEIEPLLDEAAQILEVAFAISRQAQVISDDAIPDGFGDRKKPIRN
jgi:hypothetical protein